MQIFIHKIGDKEKVEQTFFMSFSGSTEADQIEKIF